MVRNKRYEEVILVSMGVEEDKNKAGLLFHSLDLSKEVARNAISTLLRDY